MQCSDSACFVACLHVTMSGVCVRVLDGEGSCVFSSTSVVLVV